MITFHGAACKATWIGLTTLYARTASTLIQADVRDFWCAWPKRRATGM